MFDAKVFLRDLEPLSGVYQMYNAKQELLYVGKAKNLKSRVSSYFNSQSKSLKTQALVEKIAAIQVTITSTEVEALLLEQNLIKLHHPPYNILLRDDKSYPYIKISSQHAFAQISLYRARQVKDENCYGPYPSSGAVRESLSFLQKVFKVRQCEDTYFNNRSRPCLEHQIDRCTAPCVGLISQEDYAQDIKHVEMFLAGRTQDLTQDLSKQMEAASKGLEFELAAKLRDQIRALRHVQASQNITNLSGNADVIGIYQEMGLFAVQVLVIREGNMLGGRCHEPLVPKNLKGQGDEASAEVLEAFVTQYYAQVTLIGGVPDEIILSHELPDNVLIEDYLQQIHHKKMPIKIQVRAHRRAWQDMALKNAEQQVKSRLRATRTYVEKNQGLSDWLSDEANRVVQIKRIECFDISHTQGGEALGSCVVFNIEGAKRSDYRRFNIKTAVGGDDYASMKEVLARRFKRQLDERAVLADLLLIDGGKGQVSQAASILFELGLTQIFILGIAKGPSRKAGLENFFRVEFLAEGDPGGPFTIQTLTEPEVEVMYYLQEIRDEAHRFAIVGHRQRRKKRQLGSSLESIPGVGASRRRALLNHFGGLQGIARASVEDLKRVQGVSKHLAQIIYDHFQGG